MRAFGGHLRSIRPASPPESSSLRPHVAQHTLTQIPRPPPKSGTCRAISLIGRVRTEEPSHHIQDHPIRPDGPPP
jgi:hypothetical protein